jgi:hypothetical protein
MAEGSRASAPALAHGLASSCTRCTYLGTRQGWTEHDWRFDFLPSLLERSSHGANDGSCADIFLVHNYSVHNYSVHTTASTAIEARYSVRA